MRHSAPYWSALNDHLIELAEFTPEALFATSPASGAWSVGAILMHITLARDHWMANAVRDGGPGAEVPDAFTKRMVVDCLRSSWLRIERFVNDDAALAKTYEPAPFDPPYVCEPAAHDGYYIAYHRLVHDAHHRADVMHVLDELGSPPPEDRIRRPL